MITSINFRRIAIATSLIVAGVVVVDALSPFVPVGSIVGEAHAIRGRPATPTSAAGVARRTTRRRVRRSTIYIASLPRGCSQVVIEGTSLMNCGGKYYQAAGSQYVECYVD